MKVKSEPARQVPSAYFGFALECDKLVTMSKENSNLSLFNQIMSLS